MESGWGDGEGQGWVANWAGVWVLGGFEADRQEVSKIPRAVGSFQHLTLKTVQEALIIKIPISTPTSQHYLPTIVNPIIKIPAHLVTLKHTSISPTVTDDLHRAGDIKFQAQGWQGDETGN